MYTCMLCTYIQLLASPSVVFFSICIVLENRDKTFSETHLLTVLTTFTGYVHRQCPVLEGVMLPYGVLENREVSPVTSRYVTEQYIYEHRENSIFLLKHYKK